MQEKEKRASTHFLVVQVSARYFGMSDFAPSQFSRMLSAWKSCPRQGDWPTKGPVQDHRALLPFQRPFLSYSQSPSQAPNSQLIPTPPSPCLFHSQPPSPGQERNREEKSAPRRRMAPTHIHEAHMPACWHPAHLHQE